MKRTRGGSGAGGRKSAPKGGRPRQGQGGRGGGRGGTTTAEKPQREAVVKGKDKGKDKSAPTAKVAKGTGITRAKLVVHAVKCEKTTREIDKDEITVVGIMTGGVVEKEGKEPVLGKSREGKRFSAGKFKKGTKTEFKPPEEIASFPIGDARAEWPRHFLASIVLIEEDEGAIGTVVNAVIDAVDKQVMKAVSKAVTTVATGALSSAAGAIGVGAAAGSVVPLVGTAVGAAAAATVGIVFGEIKKARADDCFPPEQVEPLVLEEPPTEKGMVGNKMVARFHGFGADYKVIHSWQVE